MRALRSITLVGAAVAALGLGAGSAIADPSVNPKTTDFVAVGSDTTQALFNQWSTDYNTHLGTGKTGYLYSWDATGSAKIQTKGTPGTNPPTTSSDPNCYITRPNGSGAGIAAVQPETATTHDGHLCVDIARSSRTISSADGTGLSAVVFAKDLITWTVNSGGNGSGITSLNDTQLKAIFSCDASLLGTGKTGNVTWNEVGGTSADQIIPVLPQTSSGTRATWLSDIGVTTIKSCVVNGTFNSNPIEENEGTNAVFTHAGWAGTSTPNGDLDVIFPYSGGAYEGESFYHTNSQSPNNLVMGQIDGKNPLASAGTINTGLGGFPSTYIRSLFSVVNTNKLSTMSQILGASGTGWTCTGSSSTVGTGPYDIVHAGFTVASNCGTVLTTT